MSSGEVNLANLSQRHCIVAINGKMLTELMTHGYRDHGLEIHNGVPSGAQLVAIHAKPMNMYWLEFEHHSLPRVKEGEEIPHRMLMMIAHYDCARHPAEDGG